MVRLIQILVVVCCYSVLAACSQRDAQPPLRVGFNTWPGYEFIYLARVKGLYEKHGLEVKLVELNALGDVRRAFERGQIDIMASTMVELLIASENSRKELKVILVADASNGSDVLIARQGIDTVADLKGKAVGMEPATVDVLAAGAALRSAGMTFKDVTLVGKSQDDLVSDIESGRIEAIQTYPPYSIRLLGTGKYNVIFDTTRIPGEIIDVLSVDKEILQTRRDDIKRFLDAYFDAHAYYQANPEDASEIMGRREGISGAEFREALKGIIVFGRQDQPAYISATGKGGRALKNAGDSLYEAGWLDNKATIADFFPGNAHELYQ